MGLNIVIVDDHLIFREGLRSLICQEPDMEVVAEAGDGASAVRLAAEYLPDVILLDITMPEMNGIHAAQQIAAQTPAVRMLILSMESDRSVIVQALEAGATGYLLKDCAFTELSTAIRSVSRGETYLSPKIAHLVIKELVQRKGGDDPRPADRLTERETKVLQMIAEGKNTKEIAFYFNVSLKTIDSQRYSIMKKLELYSIAELTRYAIKAGISSL